MPEGIETLKPSMNTEYQEMQELESLTGQATEVSPWTFQKTPKERQEYVRGKTTPQRQRKAGLTAIVTDPMTYIELIVPGVAELESAVFAGEEIEKMQKEGVTWKGAGLTFGYGLGAVPLVGWSKLAKIARKGIKAGKTVKSDAPTELVPEISDTKKIAKGETVGSPVFFSSTTDYLNSAAPNKATAAQWLSFNPDGTMKSGLLRSINKKTGRPFVSSRELEESGVTHLLKRVHAKDPNTIITKPELISLVQKHPANNLRMVLLSNSNKRRDYAFSDTKPYKPADYNGPQHPGEAILPHDGTKATQNYGEMILHVDDIPGQKSYYGSHYDKIPNVAVFTRFTDRGLNNEIRFIEELQSDVHQLAQREGKKLKDAGIQKTHPDGAYKKTKVAEEIDTTEKTKEIEKVQEFIKDYVEIGEVSEISAKKSKNLDKLIKRQIDDANSRKKDQFVNLDSAEYDQYVDLSGGSKDDLLENVPFKGRDYADTALKSNLRLAAEEGKEWLAIKPAVIHSSNKSVSGPSVTEAGGWTKLSTAYEGDMRWYGTPDGKSSLDHNIKLYNRDGGAVEIPVGTNEQVLPDLMRKLAKQHDTQVKTISFKDGEGVLVEAFAIKINDSMRNPFPLYHKKEGGLVTLWTKPIF